MEKKSNQIADVTSHLDGDFLKQTENLSDQSLNHLLKKEDNKLNWISVLLEQRKDQDNLKTKSVKWSDVAHTAFICCSLSITSCELLIL